MLEKNSRCGKRKSFHNDGFYCCKSHLISVKRCLNVVSTIYVSHLIHLTHLFHEKFIICNPVLNRSNLKLTHCLYDREKQVFIRIKLAFERPENRASEAEVINKNSEKISKNDIPRKNLNAGRKSSGNHKSCNDCNDYKYYTELIKCTIPNEPSKKLTNCITHVNPHINFQNILRILSYHSHYHPHFCFSPNSSYWMNKKIDKLYNITSYFHSMSHTTRPILLTTDELTEATDQHSLEERLDENLDVPCGDLRDPREQYKQ